MWRSFFKDKKWFYWSYGGGFFIITLLVLQTYLDVLFNSWYKDFYDILQTAEERDISEFWQSIKKAKVEGEIGHLGVITKAADNGVWQASAWFMERSNPEEWGKRERNKLEDGKEDEEIHVVIRYSS